MTAPRILVAGIGNIFLGDDAFGSAVAQVLAQRHFPEGVRVEDFGIRGFDLAFAMLEDYAATIMVDAAPRGGSPGTLYVIEPDLGTAGVETTAAQFETHGLDPVQVLQLVKQFGQQPGRILLVGCEPATFGPEQGQMGLSDCVAAAVKPAVELVESLVLQIRREVSQSETSQQELEAG